MRQTIRWLDKHGVAVAATSCFMGEKDQVGADVYIDDSPDNIAALRAAGHFAILFCEQCEQGHLKRRGRGNGTRCTP